MAKTDRMSYTQEFVRCPAEKHAHLDDRCYQAEVQCLKEVGHSMRGWHRNDLMGISWDHDDRDTCPRNTIDEASVVSGATS
jgi:hypothetical protein